ncbi:STAS domain-containing protein [Sphaerisporangium corydalis]|uniref:STAS domain-containing protein n=1 Tax=Sphaerisporangium corydalis TaxID=1441875 RepID=A0ABV9ES09_9ACTN|nr:STAS domain-containing protein [Sphaerisporangium corydalis]
MTPLVIRAVHDRGCSVLSVAGELDALSRPQLERALDRLRAEGHQRVILDVAELSFCDSAGLRLMLLNSHRCFEAGGWFGLRGIHRPVSRLVDLLGVRTQVVTDAPFTYVLAAERERISPCSAGERPSGVETESGHPVSLGRTGR